MQAILNAEQLGKVLKGYRRDKKLTQTEVGGTVGLLQKTVSKLEREPQTTSIESLFKLLSALELEIMLKPIKDKTNEFSIMDEW